MEDHCNVSAVVLFGLLYVSVYFSLTGAVTLSGSSEYAVPGTPFNLTCDVPDEAVNVTFYRSPDLVVGSIKVLRSSCYFYNDIIDIPCNESLCECQPTRTGFGRIFNWVIRPTEQDHSSSWFCVRYNPERINVTSYSPNYILQTARSPREDMFLSPSSTVYDMTENEVLPDIICTAYCRPSCTFVWTTPNSIYINASVLSLGQLYRTEQGPYTCTARNEYGTNLITITVLVKYGPGESVVLNPSPNLYIKNEGATLQDITCTADCRPSCKFVWTKPDNKKFTLSPVLSLGKLYRSEHGRYMCNAWNEVSSATREINVTVQYGPGASVALSPSPNLYIENEGATLHDITCTADCRPSCKFVWTKSDNNNFTLSPVLSLGQLHRSEHGRYMCNAWNEVSSATREINVTVQYPPKILNLRYSQGNADVTENKAKSISCTVDSYPSSNITWYFNNTALLTTSDVTESTFTLANAGCLDTGLYTCAARNSVSNTPTNMDTSINVLCKPRIDNRVNTVVEIGIGLSRDMVLSASYISNPEPSFTWQFHTGAMTVDLLDGKERVSIRNTYNATGLSAVSTLKRSRMEERWFGIYIVTVTNDQGSDTLIYTVSAADKPKPPYQGKANCPFANRARLSWTSDFNGGSEQTFVVGMKGVQDDSYMINTDTKYDDPGRGKIIDVEISGLLPNRLYFFNVIAINEHGNSSLVNVVNCTTKAIPLVEDSNTGGIVAGVVVSVLVIAGISIAVFIFRRKVFTVFTYCKKGEKHGDTEMTSSGEGNTNTYDSLNRDQVGTSHLYGHFGDQTEANQANAENANNTYEPLQAADIKSQQSSVIYEDLHAPEGKQKGSATKGAKKAIKKNGQKSGMYINVQYPRTVAEPEPTYVNAIMKKKRKKKNKS